MAEFTFTTKYAKYDEKKQRRETWDETVSRVERMHLKKFFFLGDEDKEDIKKAFNLVREKKIIPSMRSMQFGGKAIEAHQLRMFNCSVTHIHSLRSFAESFYALLCGTGVGFGISNRFLSRLPNLVEAKDKTGTVLTYTIEDNIEGWADSLEALLNCYFKNTPLSGRKIVFDYSKIRKKGAKLKTGGGKAPGYKGLKNTHIKIKHLLDRIIEENHQNRLKTIDAYDILMHTADAVLSGGIRRSACSVIFDADDSDMMNAKTGDWFVNNPQRGRSNNSAIIIRGKTSFEEFNSLIQKTKQFGEPGFLYVIDDRQLLNPCFTIDTKILTQDGWRTFDSLLGKNSVNILQDNRVQGILEGKTEIWDIDVNGEPFTVTNLASNIQKTGKNRDIFELKLKCGRTVKATGNHHFATKRGMIELKDLSDLDEVLIPVADVYEADKNSESYKLGNLVGMVFGDGTYDEKNVYIDIWSNDARPAILSKIERDAKFFIRKNIKDLELLTNWKDSPKFSKNSSVAIGNVTKYRLSSSLLRQIFQKNGINSKDDGRWLHSKDKDFKTGFLTGMFYCDGHSEYNEKSRTLSFRLGSINFELLKNIQLVLQELGTFSRINLAKKAGFSMLPDSNREYKKYETQNLYRLIIGGKLNCVNFAKTVDLPQKDKNRLTYALSVSQVDIKNKFFSKVDTIKYVGKQDVYCLKEDVRRTLIAEGMTARRCFEINFIPVTDDGRCGFQMCNLTSINGAKVFSLTDFEECSWGAALIGTLQAAYTHFPYLGLTSEELTKNEALLGVSITGMMDNPDVTLHPENQQKCAKIVVETNEKWAKKIGINPSARTTCLKPEGSSSIVLGSASGIHPHHSFKYIRRIQMNKEDNVYKFFKLYNPHACEESVWSANKTDDVISFPIEVPKQAKIKSDFSALEHLEIIKSTQKNWVEPGSTVHNNKKFHHSVSCTVLVKDNEWKKVTKYLFDNQEYFTAVSLLPYTGDKIYQQAPMEAVITPEDEEKWNNLAKEWNTVDYSKLVELDDETTHAAEIACAGGQCEVVKI